MLFRSRFAPLIARGEVTETWRAWARPQAKVGGVYRVVGGLAVEVLALDRIPLSDADPAAARSSGFADVASMVEELRKHRPELDDADLVWRVRFKCLGHDDRPGPVYSAELSAEEVDAIAARLAGHDARSANGPWTADTLRLIAEHPGRRAGDLADMLGWERLPFKANVRKLKALGLTESLEVGYRLSPRGSTYLALRQGWRR